MKRENCLLFAFVLGIFPLTFMIFYGIILSQNPPRREECTLISKSYESYNCSGDVYLSMLKDPIQCDLTENYRMIYMVKVKGEDIPHRLRSGVDIKCVCHLVRDLHGTAILHDEVYPVSFNLDEYNQMKNEFPCYVDSQGNVMYNSKHMSLQATLLIVIISGVLLIIIILFTCVCMSYDYTNGKLRKRKKYAAVENEINLENLDNSK